MADEVRATQLVSEALLQPDDAAARATQLAAETVLQPGDTNARITQVVIEVLLQSRVLVSDSATGTDVPTRGSLKSLSDSGQGSEALRRSRIYRVPH